MALWLVFSTAAIAACRDSAVDLKGPWGSARFGVELALTPAQMARGLMHRTSLPNSAGMLFLYEKPGSPGFWMKNTLIPLDMLFITPQGVVRKIHHNAQPGDLTPVTAGPGIIAVLESTVVWRAAMAFPRAACCATRAWTKPKRCGNAKAEFCCHLGLFFSATAG